MRFFSKSKNQTSSENAAAAASSSPPIFYNGIPVEISLHVAQSGAHLAEDFAVLQQEGIEHIIRSRFIPWLKTDVWKDRDDDLIYQGLKLYAIDYCYSKIVSRYSPTGTDELIGQFEFCFESGNEYTADMMESVAMQVYVWKGKVLKVDGFEV